MLLNPCYIIIIHCGRKILSLVFLPLKHIPSIHHIVLLRNPQRSPGIRNHAFALVATLDRAEQEGLAGGVHLVAGQHVALAVKQIPTTGAVRGLPEPVPAIPGI